MHIHASFRSVDVGCRIGQGLLLLFLATTERALWAWHTARGTVTPLQRDFYILKQRV